MSQEDLRSVHIPIGKVTLEGELGIPAQARGIVIFAHGSGSSRLSPRNQFVAKALRKKNLGTLLFDLLTREEEEVDLVTTEFRFDIDLLAERLGLVAHWLRQEKQAKGLPMGYFGSSTGAAAALIAAAKKEAPVTAVVSRGGRPDLAASFLPHVEAATLLIVGGEDTVVIGLNKEAYELLACEKKLEIVPGATHLFEEPGTLEQVAELAGEWFAQHFVSR